MFARLRERVTSDSSRSSSYSGVCCSWRPTYTCLLGRSWSVIGQACKTSVVEGDQEKSAEYLEKGWRSMYFYVLFESRIIT